MDCFFLWVLLTLFSVGFCAVICDMYGIPLLLQIICCSGLKSMYEILTSILWKISNTNFSLDIGQLLLKCKFTSPQRGRNGLWRIILPKPIFLEVTIVNEEVCSLGQRDKVQNIISWDVKMPKASALANVWPWMNQEWPRKSLSWRWPLLSPRNRVYHLYKSVAFTGKRPRRPETVWNIGHPEKQDYFFRCSVAHGNFPFSKSRVPFTFRQVNNHDH